MGDMNEGEKIDFVGGRKEIATKLVQSKRYELALERYKKIVEIFNYTDNFQEESKQKANELNKALCYLKDDPFNQKALFRLAQAEAALKNFSDALVGLRKLLELDPKNAEALRLVHAAKKGQKEVDQKCKGMYSKMCAGLGKLPARTDEKPSTVLYDEAGQEMDVDMA